MRHSYADLDWHEFGFFCLLISRLGFGENVMCQVKLVCSIQIIHENILCLHLRISPQALLFCDMIRFVQILMRHFLQAGITILLQQALSGVNWVLPGTCLLFFNKWAVQDDLCPLADFPAKHATKHNAIHACHKWLLIAACISPSQITTEMKATL